MTTRLRKVGMRKGYFFPKKKVSKRGTFPAKMVYERVKGWTSGKSLPVLNFVKSPPPPPGVLFSTLFTNSTNVCQSVDPLYRASKDPLKGYHPLWTIYYSLLLKNKNRILKIRLLSSTLSRKQKCHRMLF